MSSIFFTRRYVMHARIHEEFQLLQHIMAVAEFSKKVRLYPNLTFLVTRSGQVFA